ncbi:hypothetical protein LCGC14_1173320 [marine sediment metagenome]|uniref:Uncharacterized protein n=1 Tax=marine sediment metagenome TaxID=412755 RepID=A0A0F9PUQ8_9ZZZZ
MCEQTECPLYVNGKSPMTNMEQLTLKNELEGISEQHHIVTHDSRYKLSTVDPKALKELLRKIIEAL